MKLKGEEKHYVKDRDKEITTSIVFYAWKFQLQYCIQHLEQTETTKNGTDQQGQCILTSKNKGKRSTKGTIYTNL